jgi:hypothetical protein
MGGTGQDVPVMRWRNEAGAAYVVYVHDIKSLRKCEGHVPLILVVGKNLQNKSIVISTLCNSFAFSIIKRLVRILILFFYPPYFITSLRAHIIEIF